MPIRRTTPEVSPLAAQLVEQLVQELQAPHDDGADYPLIYEEQLPGNRRMHVTVVWDAWANLDKGKRGGVILDAYRQHAGPDATFSISLAMGLTRDEAERLQIAL